MDPVLLDACGDVLAAQFAGVTKVLTGAEVLVVASLAALVSLNRFELWSTS